MTQDQFSKLFLYIQDFRREVDSRFDAIDKRFDSLLAIVDGYANKVDSYAQEMTFGDQKVNRLEGYINVIAEKVDVDLSKIT